MEQTEKTELSWGPWLTAGFGLIVLVVSIMGQMVASFLYTYAMILNNPQMDAGSIMKNAVGDGTLLSAAIITGSFIGCLLVVLFAWIRAKSKTMLYLGFSSIRLRTILICICATALFVAIADFTTYLLDRPVVPEFMESAYSTVVFKPLLWFAACVAAPCFEELFFRGFLIKGWETSGIGSVGAVILTSIIWTGIHLQYGWYELTQIFILGLLFGTMRVKTGSTTLPFACHVFANVIATIETAILVSRSM